MDNKTQEKRKIFVIDDNKSIYELFNRGLNKTGFKIDYADNGHDALQILRWQDFDIIFLDIVMPKMYGLEVIRNIKKIKHKMPTVVMMTGYSSKELIEEALKLGAVCCMRKPFEIEELLDIVNKHMLQE